MMENVLKGCLIGMILSAFFAVGVSAEDLADGYTIGVSYYNPDEWEGIAIKEYLDDYIGGNFDVSFVYNAERIDSAEDEIAFVEELHEMGVQGLISTMSTYVEEVLPVCEQYGMYYMLAYVTISDEEFESIKDNPYFLGVIGPSVEDEFQAGEAVAEYLALLDEGRDFSYLVVTGGSCMGNEMHRLRTVGILTGLQEIYGLTYDVEIEELAEVSEITEAETGTSMKLTLLPGYLTDGEQICDLLSGGEFDAVASCMTISYAVSDIVQLESKNSYDIKIGMVDCFTAQSYEFFNETDSNGDSKVNCIVGKYGASIAPAFVAMCNAYGGYMEDFRDNGSAFKLHQSLWYAPDTEAFNEQYALSIGITENTYSAVDMMQVMKAFNADADFVSFCAFAEK